MQEGSKGPFLDYNEGLKFKPSSAYIDLYFQRVFKTVYKQSKSEMGGS